MNFSVKLPETNLLLSQLNYPILTYEFLILVAYCVIIFTFMLFKLAAKLLISAQSEKPMLITNFNVFQLGSLREGGHERRTCLVGWGVASGGDQRRARSHHQPHSTRYKKNYELESQKLVIIAKNSLFLTKVI